MHVKMGGLFEDSQNGRVLADAARGLRMVFFTGLPASGKSFFLRKQISIAVAAGRKVDIIRWDAGLGAFETDDVLARYPYVADGTNPMIRRAAGLWGRQAISNWLSENREPSAMLIGEVPIIGNRFSEFVEVIGDEAEKALASNQTLFLYPIPSQTLRIRQESIRRETFNNPQHPNEAKDAPPSTMDLALQMTLEKAMELRLISASRARSDYAYDPALYRRFFEQLLKHRVARALDVDTLYVDEGSAHDLAGYNSELIATSEEVTNSMLSVEASLTATEASKMVRNWYRV